MPKAKSSSEVLLLTNEEVAQLLTAEVCVEALEEAYRELGNGAAVNRPRTHTHLPTAEPEQFYRFKSMEGGISKSSVYALRITSDLVRFARMDGRARQQKVPRAAGNSYLGLVLLFSAQNGDLLAIFPDGMIQGMRVGATSAVAAKYLSRRDSHRLGLIGAGWQARWLMRSVAVVRRIDAVKVYSPRESSRTQFAAEMNEELGIPVTPVESAKTALEEADIVATATNAIEPVLRWEWLPPGAHVASTTQREIDDDTLRHAAVLIVNARMGAGTDYLSEDTPREQLVLLSKLHHQRPVDWAKIPELAELVAGKTEGRTRSDQITLFLNNIGLGVQFAAVGARLYQQARASGAGRKLPLAWFVESLHP